MSIEYLLTWFTGISIFLNYVRERDTFYRKISFGFGLCLFALYQFFEMRASYIVAPLWFAYLLYRSASHGNSSRGQDFETSESRQRPYATYFLIALHLCLFVGQLIFDERYGARASVTLGALSSTLVLEYQQYWRVFSCLFLHADLIHFASNMFGLYVLGPFVEYALGRALFILCYLLSGVGASLFVIVLTHYEVLRESFLLGASGAVLGLVGATTAVLYYLWRMRGERGVLQQLRSVGLILFIQAAFDLSTPQVSFHAHLGGVISGLIVTYLLILLVRVTRSKRKPEEEAKA